MRRIMLVVVAVFLLSACGKQHETTPLAEQGAMTWQEQYDLGMRYLTEGNYTEAIIAFTAAIEIDPKRVEAYIGRGDAYVGSGETTENLAAAQADYETALELDDTSVNAYLGLADVYTRCNDYDKAQEVLQIGLDKTGGDERIAAKLAEVEKGRLPALNEFGGTTFELRNGFCKYEELDEVPMNLIAVMAQAAINNDRELMLSVMNGVPEEDHYGGYTLWNGYKVRYSLKSNWVEIELRPENGNGYLCYAGNTDNDAFDYFYSYDRYIANCRSWQWDGNMTADRWEHRLWKGSDDASIETYQTCYEYGKLQEGLRVGTITCQWHTKECASFNNYETQESDSTVLYNYNNGICVSIDDRKIDNGGLCSISDAAGMGNYSTNQFTLDKIYW